MGTDTRGVNDFATYLNTFFFMILQFILLVYSLVTFYFIIVLIWNFKWIKVKSGKFISNFSSLVITWECEAMTQVKKN
jgi:hypothetical protein